MHFRLVLVAVALFASAAFASEPVPSAIIATWLGDARFFDKRIRALTGPLESRLRIAEDLSLSGKLGDATIPSTAPASRSARRLEYRIVLQGQVMQIPELVKTHLVIIVTAKPDALLDVDFHLKSRFGFDPTMLVGHYDVVRRE